MILQALLILLFILIISNIILGIYNKVSTPCNTAEEFFRNANAITTVGKSLDSIPVTDSKYFYGTILNSEKKQGNYLTDSQTVESYANPSVAAQIEDESDCAKRERRYLNVNSTYSDVMLSEEAKAAIEGMFPTGSLNDARISSKTDKRGTIADYNIVSSELQPTNSTKMKNVFTSAHVDIAHDTKVDGYQSM